MSYRRVRDASRRIRVLLLAVAIVAVEVLLGSEVGHGGWHHASYALFLVAGFLAALAGTLALYDLGVRRTPVTRGAVRPQASQRIG